MPNATPTRASGSLFELDLRRLIDRARATLLAAFDQLGADPSRPQEVARRFGLNKNLTWKVAKVLGESNVFAAAQQLPGSAAVDILADALERSGLDAAHAGAIRSLNTAVDDFISTHAGDRTTLDLILDSLAPPGPTSQTLDASRKMAFRGNSGVFGVQCRVRHAMYVIAPSRTDPERADIGVIGSMLGMRRLRAGTRWPLTVAMVYSDSGEKLAEATREPIAPDPADADRPGHWPMLVRRFCSANMPEVRAIQRGRMAVVELAESPVGNTGAFDLCFGHILRSIPPRRRSAQETGGEFMVAITTPIETLVVDIIAHRDMPEALAARPWFLWRTHGEALPPAERTPGDAIPIPELPHRAGAFPPRLSDAGAASNPAPALPHADEMLALTAARMGHAPEDFAAVRLVVPFPPMPSACILRYELPA